MKSTIRIAAAVLLSSSLAYAEEKPLTVQQCISILTGLNSLNCQGQQLGDRCESKDPHAYKLGNARMTIALDLNDLGPVQMSYQRAVQGHQLEYQILPPAPTDGKPDPFATEREKQNRDFSSYQLSQLDAACPVTPGHLKLTDLKLGDDADHNAIPPSVLGAIMPIIDRDK